MLEDLSREFREGLLTKLLYTNLDNDFDLVADTKESLLEMLSCVLL